MSPEALLLVLGEDLPGDVAHRGDHALADTGHADQSQRSFHLLTNHSAASTSWPITAQLSPLSQSQLSSFLMRTSITSWCVQCYTSVQYSPRGSSKTTSATQTCSHLMRCHWSCHCNISTVNTTFLFSFSEKDIFSLDVRIKYDYCGCVKRCLELYFHHRCWKFWGRHNFW